MKRFTPPQQFFKLVLFLLLFAVFSCKKEAVKQEQPAKSKSTFDNTMIIKSVEDFSAYVEKKNLAKDNNLKVNQVQNNDQPYGLDYMQDTYGNPGVTAYYSPQPTLLPNYQPQPITTSDDLNYLSPSGLSQKVNSDLAGYFSFNSALSNAQNVSSAVQNSLNGFTSVLQNLATTEMDGYINNSVDMTNFNDDIYYAQVKSKVNQAFNDYRYNLGNSIGLTANEQTSILVATSYASLMAQNIDFRDELSSNNQIANNLNSAVKINSIKVNGLFSSIGKALSRVAKVIVAAVVTIAAATVGAVVGFAVGAVLGFIDPGYQDPNTISGVPLFTALGGFLYGGSLIVNKTKIWNWAWNS
ncbi:MAG: hypothetical protein EOP43_04200 [Sphingobacteriaceae bacterium]|nr:MAG: hypothetical protein EOP43_04200 [Sphingobacteriaceae bacterium]